MASKRNSSLQSYMDEQQAMELNGEWNKVNAKCHIIAHVMLWSWTQRSDVEEELSAGMKGVGAWSSSNASRRFLSSKPSAPGTPSSSSM